MNADETDFAVPQPVPSYEGWEYADGSATALDQPETQLGSRPATNGAVR